MTSLVEGSRDEIAAELERRRRGEDVQSEAARLSQDLPAFVRNAWHVVEPRARFVSNWHIDAICERLSDVDAGRTRRLLINVPPRHMKSLTVSVFWPVWRWTHQPWTRFLTGSYGESLAKRDATKSRDLLRSRWFRDRWPDVQLKGDVNRVTRYENTATGYRIATSVGGDATGEGGDVIILDDPHKAEEALSDVHRAKVIDWHAGTIASRFNDPKTGVEIVIMQRLHEGDLAGHLIETGEWEHLCLPARFEAKHPFRWPGDPRTVEGELLWPEHMPDAELGKLAAEMTAFRAAGQLQQRPAPREGVILRRGLFRTFEPRLLDDERLSELPTFRAIVCSWDTAFKEKTSSDFVAGQVWGVDGADRYLLRLFHERAGLQATKTAMRELRDWALARWPHAAVRILVEKSANGVEIIETLRREIPGMIPVVPSGDKTLRAEAAAPDLESGNVWLPGRSSGALDGPGDGTPAWVLQFVEECAVFPNGAHDDQVDAFTQAINWARGQVGGPVRANVARQRVRPNEGIVRSAVRVSA